MFGILALLLVVSPPHFRHAPGWHVGSTRAHACVGVSRARCVQAEGWASTVRYRDCPNCSPPHKTLAVLPSRGIVIQLTIVRQRVTHASSGTWPPRIRAAGVHSPVEGEPPRFSVFQAFIRSGHTQRFLFVWFGRPHPTRHQLARANAEVRTGR
jgi:hypothetical protein